MPRGSALAHSVARLQEAEIDSRTRYVELCIVLRLGRWDPVEHCWHDGGEELCRVGGRWDKRRKRYVGPAKTARVLYAHRGQEKAARWFAKWLTCRATGDWSQFRRVWSTMFVGGRRGGKSYMGMVALVMFAVMAWRSNSWAVSPTQEETDELEQAVRAMLPRSWYRWRGDPKYCFRLLNGSRIFLRSGHKPRGLKRGGLDFCLYNEAQNMSERGYIQIRGGTADTGGLTILAANPPDDPIGMWIEGYYEGCRAGKGKREVFSFDPRDNPTILYQSLQDLEDEVDDHTFRREVLGEFVPIGHVVFHAWSDSVSISEVPSTFVDITRRFCKRHFGREFEVIIGADFQRSPHMAAAIFKVFEDPDLPGPRLWIVDEFLPEDADEDDLIDAIEAGGYDGETSVVIGDASGEYQDADRTKGTGSFDWFRRRGWKWLKLPDRKMKKNPIVGERVKAGNAALKARSGLRRLYCLPNCRRTAKAMKHWENLRGVPYRGSVYAHMCDAVTYVVWRIWPRKHTNRKVEYRKVTRKRSAREKDLARF